MPTTPFSSGLVTDLEGKTSWRFSSQLGVIFTPRWFCCTDPNDLGLAEGKDPVAVIELSPNPTLVGSTVNYDGSDSYDPDGSIVAYTWTFTGQSPSSGTAVSGTFTAGTAGTFNISLVVTDGTSNKSTPARVQLVVEDPETELYVSAEGSSGIWFSEDGFTWTEKNTGISAPKNAYFVAIDPATLEWPAEQRVLWRVENGSLIRGCWVSRDGGATWLFKRPNVVVSGWGEFPSANLVSYRSLHFAGERLFLLAMDQNDDDEWRSYLWYTDDAAAIRADAGATVTWVQVTTGGWYA